MYKSSRGKEKGYVRIFGASHLQRGLFPKIRKICMTTHQTTYHQRSDAIFFVHKAKNSPHILAPFLQRSPVLTASQTATSAAQESCSPAAAPSLMQPGDENLHPAASCNRNPKFEKGSKTFFYAVCNIEATATSCPSGRDEGEKERNCSLPLLRCQHSVQLAALFGRRIIDLESGGKCA